MDLFVVPIIFPKFTFLLLHLCRTNLKSSLKIYLILLFSVVNQSLEFIYANEIVNNILSNKAHNPNFSCLKRNPVKLIFNLLRIDHFSPYSTLIHGDQFLVAALQAPMGVNWKRWYHHHSTYHSQRWTDSPIDAPNIIQHKITNTVDLIRLLKRNMKIGYEIRVYSFDFGT